MRGTERTGERQGAAQSSGVTPLLLDHECPALSDADDWKLLGVVSLVLEPAKLKGTRRPLPLDAWELGRQ